MSLADIVFLSSLLLRDFVASGDVFSSTAELQLLLQQDIEFSTSLQELASNMEKEAATSMQEQASDIEEDAESSKQKLGSDAAVIRMFLRKNYGWSKPEDLERHVAHPLNSLALVKRTSMELVRSGVMEVLTNNQEDHRKEVLTNNQEDHRKEVLNSNQEDSRKEELLNMTKQFPGIKDWEGACHGVFLLQEYYDLNTTDMAEGKISIDGKETFDSSFAMEAEELQQVGVMAMKGKYYDKAVEWFQKAVDKLRARKRNAETIENLKDAKVVLRNTIQIHDHNLDRKGVVSATHRCNPVPFDKQLLKKKKFKSARQANQTKTIRKHYSFIPLYNETNPNPSKAFEYSLRDNFNEMCRGASFRSPAMDKHLKCRLLHHHNVYLKLGPFPLEEKSHAPYITVVYNLMYDAEMEHFKEFARDKLQRSEVGAATTGSSTARSNLVRTSKQTWLPFRNYTFPNMSWVLHKYGVHGRDEIYQDIVKGEVTVTTFRERWMRLFATEESLVPIDVVAKNVAARFQLLANVELMLPFSGESFQVANYGLGGQYGPHVDAHGYWDGKVKANTHEHFFKTGDRMATIMVNLAHVDAGGATTFPNTGVRMSPIKGSGAFWLNQKTGGAQDQLTHHGGCPVLVGSKWITNMWVGYKQQFNKWLCSRREDHRFPHFTAYF